MSKAVSRAEFTVGTGDRRRDCLVQITLKENIVFEKMFKDATCVQGRLGFQQEFERLWLVVKDAVVKRRVPFRCSLLQTVAVARTCRW